MTDTTTHITQPPASVLTIIARAHFFISQETDEDQERRHELLFGEMGALATFSCLVWSKGTWKAILKRVRQEGLPKLTHRKLEELHRESNADWLARFQKKRKPIESFDDKDMLDVKEAIRKSDWGYDVFQIWRQHGYNLVWEAVAEIEKVDAGLADTLGWCQSDGLQY